MEQSILRRLPMAMGLTQRLVLEGVAFRISAIDIIYKRISSFLPSKADEVNSHGAYEQRVGRIADCWALIDQAHGLYKLLELDADVFLNEELSGILSQHKSSVSHMRDKMDHLHSNRGNLSKQKKPESNYLGDFVYIVSDDSRSEAGSSSIGYAYVDYTANVFTFNHRQSQERRMDYKPSEVVGTCLFEAFGYQFNITKFVGDLSHFVPQFEANVIRLVANNAAHHALAQNQSFSEMTRPPAELVGSVTQIYKDDDQMTVTHKLTELKPQIDELTARVYDDMQSKIDEKRKTGQREGDARVPNGRSDS